MFAQYKNSTTYFAHQDHFTGKGRDAESGLDNFGARYYSSAAGRFQSPDLPFIDQHPTNPQSWNLYTYVRNNPLSLVDPTGKTAESASFHYMPFEGGGPNEAGISDSSWSTSDNFEPCQYVYVNLAALGAISGESVDTSTTSVTVNLNIVYDSDTNRGEGLTSQQKDKFQTEILGYAQNLFKQIGIGFNVTEVDGQIYRNSMGGIIDFSSGFKTDAINVFLSALVPTPGTASCSPALDLDLLNPNLKRPRK